MPELPEVETTLHGIAPHITHKTLSRVVIRQLKLRWPIPEDLSETLSGQTVQSCRRRAKYLLIEWETGVLLIHLGMSGSLRIFREKQPAPDKHDHVDFIFADNTLLRYHDPRRFGAVLWLPGVAEHHELLRHLGPEPLSEDFTAEYLHERLRGKKRAVKLMLMDNTLVVGVGNIYANEALFAAGILPTRRADRVSAEECRRLVAEIRSVLQRALKAGGSSLRDFLHSDGQSGYFQQQYQVYGREGEPCRQCGTPIARQTIGQRSSFYCPQCQR